MTGGGHPKLDVLAAGAHPDDVELACGGTLALMASRGRAVGIVHLTRGESGTRGSAEERRREATGAARALGAATLDLLDCGDGELRAGRAEEDALIRLLRRYRPEVVLAPPPRDRHPDHGRAHALVAAAAFYAGLAGRRLDGADADLAPHRPAAVFHYMQHDSFDPAFVVDVTPAWEAKKAALACYGSQLQVPADWGGGEGGARAARPAATSRSPRWPPGSSASRWRGACATSACWSAPPSASRSAPPCRWRWATCSTSCRAACDERGGRGAGTPSVTGSEELTMKIGISCYPTFGGSGVVASELAMALADGGDEVHVISYAMPSRLTIRSPRLYFHEVVVPRYPLFDYPPYSLALATKMVEVARHQDLDLMHVHYAVPNAVSAVLARQILAPRRCRW